MCENKYLYLTVLSVNMLCCVCFVNYTLDRDFRYPTTKKAHSYTTYRRANATTLKLHDLTTGQIANVTVNDGVSNTVNGTIPNINSTSARNVTTTVTPKTKRRKPKINVKQFTKQCPETERPSNIGTYEIPTQRDLVLFTKRILLKMFDSYHAKTLYLLKDIKQATRATLGVEKKCHGKDKLLYKKCVNQVSKQCVAIIKDLVAVLERQEEEVIALTEDKICTLTSMKTDPIQLIKILAMDEATLDFALPAFLRLLGGCSEHCNRPSSPDHRPRLHQMTDQDLVVRYFLTSKNYVNQHIKDTNTYV